MLTLVIFGVISAVWLSAGIAMIVAPRWWSGQVILKFSDPFHRFLALQATALAGMLLLLGAAEPERSWLWITIGAVMTTKALILLGLRDRHRERLLIWWTHSPMWVHRVAGVIMVTLAALLAVEAFRLYGR